MITVSTVAAKDVHTHMQCVCMCMGVFRFLGSVDVVSHQEFHDVDH